jgi:hypothetical protein
MNAHNKLSLSLTDEELRQVFVEYLEGVGESQYAEMLKTQCWSCDLCYDKRINRWTILLKEAVHHPRKCKPEQTYEDVNDIIPEDYPMD